MKWTLRLARGIGSTVAGLWLLIGALHGIGHSEPWTWESTVITLLVAASALGVLVVWWREAIGGVVLVTMAMLFSAFAWASAGQNKGFAMLISRGPFLLAGVLFLLVWWRTRKLAGPGRNHHTGNDGHVD